MSKAFMAVAMLLGGCRSMDCGRVLPSPVSVAVTGEPAKTIVDATHRAAEAVGLDPAVLVVGGAVSLLVFLTILFRRRR